MQSLSDAANDKSLEKELQSCEHFLVEDEIRRGRHSVVNFVANSFRAQVIEEKLDRVLDKLKCAGKLNLALGFILKNIEDGKIRYFYAHENNTLLQQSKLVSNKDDMAKWKEILKKTDVIDSCTKERSNTKWRFFKLINLTLFAASLGDIPICCRDAVLPKCLLKKLYSQLPYLRTEHQKAYKDNLCLFRALALHLHGNKRLEEETSMLFNLFLNNSTNLDTSKFQGVCIDDIPYKENIVGINIFLNHIKLLTAQCLGNLHDEASKSTRRMFN